MAATLAQIKTLRDRTGAGLGDCKAALKETGGDLSGAARLLKRRQQAQERAEAREKATRKRAAQADEGPDPTELIGPLKARLEAIPEDLVARRDAFGDLLRDLEPLAPGPGLGALVDALLPALEDWSDEVRSTRADDPWTRRFLEGEADPRLRLFRRLSAAYLSSSWTGESLCLDDGPIRRDRAGAIDALMTVGDGLRQLHLSYQTLGREAARLLLRGPLASLEGLDLDDAGAWTWDADILDAPWASRLRRLRASDSGLDLERTLALCFACPELEHLALGKNPLLELPEPLEPGERPLLDGAPEALWSLAQADLPAEERLAQGISRLRALREVELESTGVGERTCAVLAELPHLRSADLSGNPIGAEGLAELGRSASLRRLDLSETRGDGILGLASLTLEELCWQGNRLPALEELRALRLGALDLRHTPLDDAALAGLCALDLDVLCVGGALVASPSAWPLQLSIRGLEIYEGALSSGAFAALAHTPGFEGLRVLTLWRVPLAEDGAAALARTQAEELVLYGTGLGAEALAAAVHREDWRPRKLFLHGLQLTEAVALALAESPVLREVETLHLSECTGVGDAFCEALVGAGQARALRLLRLEETQVGAKGATALLDWGKPRYIGLERCRTGAAGKAIKARNRFA